MEDLVAVHLLSRPDISECIEWSYRAEGGVVGELTVGTQVLRHGATGPVAEARKAVHDALLERLDTLWP